MAVATLACRPALANFSPPLSGCRTLSLCNLHTGESLKTVYWEDGEYRADALGQLGHLLRDHRSDESLEPDTRLLDLLNELQSKTGNRKPWEVISAFRSMSTNENLRKSSTGVARYSYHCLGRAIDVRLPGTSLQDLRDSALSLQAGGVGYYSRSEFVHLDTGPVRSW